MLLRHRRFRELFAAVAAGVVLVLVTSRVIAPTWPIADWLLTACEVGQGDAMVLSTGEEGTAVVVDTGPEPSLVDSCLDRLGIGTMALLILTHLHADHIDGLPGAMDGRTVGAIAVGPGREPAKAWQDVQWQAADRGIPVVELKPGMRWASGELTLTVLGPKKEFRGTDSDPEQRLGGGDGRAGRRTNSDDRRHRDRGATGAAELRGRPRRRRAQGPASRVGQTAGPIRAGGVAERGRDRGGRRQRLRPPEPQSAGSAGAGRCHDRAAHRRAG